MTSPVAMLCSNLLHSMSGATEFSSFFSDTRRADIVRGLFRSYYADSADKKVIFDTNRTWTARLPLVARVFPEVQVICCVRSVGWVLDSIERLVRKNALQPSRLFNYKPGGSVYSRIETLMDPEKGMVGMAWTSLREAWFSEQASRLLLVDYETFVQHPTYVLSELYKRMGMKQFEHNLNDIKFNSSDYDADLGLSGLHDIRPQISFAPRPSCLPPDLFAKYDDSSFWLNPKLNPRGASVLANKRSHTV